MSGLKETPSQEDWLISILPENSKVGVDPWIIAAGEEFNKNIDYYDYYEESFALLQIFSFILIGVSCNLFLKGTCYYVYTYILVNSK